LINTDTSLTSLDIGIGLDLDLGVGSTTDKDSVHIRTLFEISDVSISLMLLSAIENSKELVGFSLVTSFTGGGDDDKELESPYMERGDINSNSI
jgi:hypothetical protein